MIFMLKIEKEILYKHKKHTINTSLDILNVLIFLLKLRNDLE